MAISGQEIAPGVIYLGFNVSNVYLIGERGGPWAIVDTGIRGHAEAIADAGEKGFGEGVRPEALILTHGHFDHVGSAQDVADLFDIPIYGHEREMPFLTGRDHHPPGDPTTGGFFAFLYRTFPRSGTDLGARVRTLPEDGSVPGAPGWRWVHTPGHTPGHVSLFRESDRTLIAGDAVLTVDLDKIFDVVTKKQKISRPPTPATPDWQSARTSVQTLAELRPQLVATGHGLPMSGPEVAQQVTELARHFPFPEHGRYAYEPAITDQNGVVELPPPAPDPLKKVLLGLAALWLTRRWLRRRRSA